MNKTIHPVILVGGSGTRLWPLSRKNFPKQFIKISGEYSLFQQTLQRIKGIHNLGRLYLVVSESTYFICLDQLNELSINNVDIIVEPEGRNTAPAIAVVAEKIRCDFPAENSVMLVLPSDHLIKNPQKFCDGVNQISEIDIRDKLILFGVLPTYPASAYGYIQIETSTNDAVKKVSRFIEKPDQKNAEELLAKAHVFWNSGMFVFNPQTVLDELSAFHPDITELAQHCVAALKDQTDTYHLNATIFAKMPNIAIDVAVMEKTKKAYVLPLQSDWSDLGDWNAINDSEEGDADGNVKIGQVISLDTKNSYLRSEKKLLATIGVENLVVVSTKDSVLIADKSKSQSVKTLVELLKNSTHEELIFNDLKVHRPWGTYESIFKTDSFQVKHIVVKPGGKLSLQLHHHRSEHWVVVSGVADVVCGEHVFQLKKNESTFIPKKTKHRLLNLQTEPLHLVEVQVGDYVGEDDIVRFDDIYGRVSEKETVDM